MDKITLHSYAKLNLYLNVLGLRKDGYHDLETIFERITLSDKITIRLLPGKKIKVSSNMPSLPQDSSNLAYKAAQLLQEASGTSRGADIRITKRIPVGSGMAGGSSNAATVLTGLNKLWGLHLNRQKLVDLAKKAGSDVAFFLYGAPFALGKGRGERIRPINTLDKRRFWHVIVVPRINVATPLVYRHWDRLMAAKTGLTAALTTQRKNVKILTSALAKNDFSLIGKSFFNSLEPVAASLYREIGRIRQELACSGQKAVLMSGSGPTVFCLVASRKEGEKLCRRLKKNRFWQVFAARTH